MDTRILWKAVLKPLLKSRSIMSSALLLSTNPLILLWKAITLSILLQKANTLVRQDLHLIDQFCPFLITFTFMLPKMYSKRTNSVVFQGTKMRWLAFWRRLRHLHFSSHHRPAHISMIFQRYRIPLQRTLANPSASLDAAHWLFWICMCGGMTMVSCQTPTQLLSQSLSSNRTGRENKMGREWQSK